MFIYCFNIIMRGMEHWVKINIYLRMKTRQFAGSPCWRITLPKSYVSFLRHISRTRLNFDAQSAKRGHVLMNSFRSWYSSSRRPFKVRLKTSCRITRSSETSSAITVIFWVWSSLIRPPIPNRFPASEKRKEKEKDVYFIKYSNFSVDLFSLLKFDNCPYFGIICTADQNLMMTACCH